MLSNDDWVAYLGTLANDLSLLGYEYGFHFGGQGLEEGCLAQVTVTDTRHSISVTVGRLFEEASPEMQRMALTHELIHAILNPIGQVTRRLQPIVGDALGRYVYDTVHDEMEVATDHLAKLIAPHLALPTPGFADSDKVTACVDHAETSDA